MVHKNEESSEDQEKIFIFSNTQNLNEDQLKEIWMEKFVESCEPKLKEAFDELIHQVGL